LATRFFSRSLVGGNESLPKQRVKSPKTVETAGECDVDDRQGRIRQQLLRQKELVSLCQLNGGYPEILQQDAPEMPIAYPEPGGQI
jgi:hypothetical protein